LPESSARGGSFGRFKPYANLFHFLHKIVTYAQLEEGDIVVKYIVGIPTEIGEVIRITYLPHADSYVAILKTFGKYQWRWVGSSHDVIDIKGESRLKAAELSQQCQAWYHFGIDYVREHRAGLYLDDLEQIAANQVRNLRLNKGLPEAQLRTMAQAFVRGAHDEFNYHD